MQDLFPILNPPAQRRRQAQHRRPDGAIDTSRLSSAGRPSPLVTVAILDENGRAVPRGERGEICVRGSLVMAGYYRNPEATAEASAHGWHHTGDIGFLDDDGFLYIVDRAKDMVITGGFNVYSAEVEQALMAYDAVRDCAVIGLPDEKWGERVTAVVQPQDGAEIDTHDLIAFVKQQGAQFSVGVMAPDGSGERLLTTSYFADEPTWAPNGRVIMFERKLADDVVRPILFYRRGGTCERPYVKGLTIMVNSIFNGWRMEDVWLDK